MNALAWYEYAVLRRAWHFATSPAHCPSAGGYTACYVTEVGNSKRLHAAALQVKAVNGSSILRLLKGLGLAPEIPEDLYHLIKKAVSMRKHLELFRKDKDGKFRLILVESRIHRLARYYRVSAQSVVA